MNNLSLNKPTSVLTLVESDRTLMRNDFGMIDDHQFVDSEEFCNHIIRAENKKQNYYSNNKNVIQYSINTPYQQVPSLYSGPGFSSYRSEEGTYVFIVCADMSLLLPINSIEESQFSEVDPTFNN